MQDELDAAALAYWRAEANSARERVAELETELEARTATYQLGYTTAAQATEELRAELAAQLVAERKRIAELETALAIERRAVEVLADYCSLYVPHDVPEYEGGSHAREGQEPTHWAAYARAEAEKGADHAAM